LIYLDTSLLLSIFVTDAHTQKAIGWIDKVRERLIVGDLARLEFAAVLSKEVRTGRLIPAIHKPLRNFDQFCARHAVHAHGADDFRIAEQFVRNLSTKPSAPDALHLASAINSRAALATFDRRLAEAAKANGVEIAISL